MALPASALWWTRIGPARSLAMLCAVVCAGETNRHSNETERHDGDGDQTFHVLCSINCLGQAHLRARIAQERDEVVSGRLLCRRASLVPRLGARGWKLRMGREWRQPCRARWRKDWSQGLRRQNPRNEQRRTCGALEDAAVGGTLMGRIAAGAVVAQCAHGHLGLRCMKPYRRRRYGHDDETQSQQYPQDGPNKPHSGKLVPAALRSQLTAPC